MDEHINNPKSPKFYVKKYLDSIKETLKNKVVIDIPAGNGVTSKILHQYGANVIAFDLFPEYFMFDKIQCQRADIDAGIPLENQTADYIICQEGIEHFSDQLKAFKEFNRLLKTTARFVLQLLLTQILLQNSAICFSKAKTLNKCHPTNLTISGCRIEH